ncbi:MAG TPA: MFS transporter, partial [Streptosporangiaceae bacterium]|nr:MFS transporter [Streptosporangiaceae bacterium]
MAETTGKLDVAETADHAANHARRWWILAVLGIAQLMVILDNTVVNIALPTAQHALGFSNADRQWVVTAYSLAFGSLLLLGGRIGDIFGRKRTLIIGLAGFAGAGGALGLLLGGILTSYTSWRWTLYINLVFAAIAATGALLWLKNDKAA